jgi:hypothetical protein
MAYQQSGMLKDLVIPASESSDRNVRDYFLCRREHKSGVSRCYQLIPDGCERASSRPGIAGEQRHFY